MRESSKMIGRLRKALVIDDSRLVCSMYELAVENYVGCDLELHFAVNGYEGIAQLTAHPDVEIIILDVNMPTVGGLEFLSYVKADPGLRDIPIVLQTTEDTILDVQRGINAGASFHLVKPFAPQRIDSLQGMVLN